MALAHVKLPTGLKPLTNGVTEVDIEATTVRKLIAALDDQFPGVGERLGTGMSVAINGEIIADAEYEEVPDGAEIHFLEALAGG